MTNQNTVLTVQGDAKCNVHDYFKKGSLTLAWPNVARVCRRGARSPRRTVRRRQGSHSTPASRVPTRTPPVASRSARTLRRHQPVVGAPGRGDSINREYYAFAIDNVGVGSASMNAPATLTQSQVQGIYQCTITNWSQVGGAPGPIQRVLPPDRLRTGNFFWTTSSGPGASERPRLLGAARTSSGAQENQYYTTCSTAARPTGPSVTRRKTNNAIFPYSSVSGPTRPAPDEPDIDLRSGLRQIALTVAMATTW